MTDDQQAKAGSWNTSGTGPRPTTGWHGGNDVQDTTTCVVCGRALDFAPRLGEVIMHTRCSETVDRYVAEAYRHGEAAVRHRRIITTKSVYESVGMQYRQDVIRAARAVARYLEQLGSGIHGERELDLIDAVRKYDEHVASY